MWCMRQNIQDKNDLNRHSHAHSSTSKYSCQLCKVTFANKGHYEGHINSHNNIKPFKCTWSAKFCFKSALLRHTKSWKDPARSNQSLSDENFATQHLQDTTFCRTMRKENMKIKNGTDATNVSVLHGDPACRNTPWVRNIKKTMDLCWNKLEQFLEPWNHLFSLDNFTAFFFPQDNNSWTCLLLRMLFCCVLHGFIYCFKCYKNKAQVW